MLNVNNTSQVVLPSWCWKGAQNEFELLLNARKYVNSNKRYPGYRVMSVTDGVALCEREEF